MSAAVLGPVYRERVFGMRAAQGAGERVLSLRHAHQVDLIAHRTRTPYEQVTTLKRWTQYLKEGVTQQHLQQQAQKQTDTQAARAMQKAKLALLARCRRKS